MQSISFSTLFPQISTTLYFFLACLWNYHRHNIIINALPYQRQTHIHAVYFSPPVHFAALHIPPPQHEAKHLPGHGGRLSSASEMVLWAGRGSRRPFPHIRADTPASWLGLHWGLPAKAHRRWRLGGQRGGRRPLLLRVWWASSLVRWKKYKFYLCEWFKDWLVA